MSLRRPVALAACALLVGAPALTACGFDYPTDRVNTIANGATNREKTVRVLNAVVVASRPKSGTVVATLANSSADDSFRLVGLSASKDAPLEATDVSTLAEEDLVGQFPGGSVNLADKPVLRVSGDFEAGQFITLNFAFDNGEQVTVEAPVVTACDQYEDLDLAPTLASQEGTIPLPEYDCGPPVAGEGVDAEISGHGEDHGDETGSSESEGETEEAE